MQRHATATEILATAAVLLGVMVASPAQADLFNGYLPPASTSCPPQQTVTKFDTKYVKSTVTVPVKNTVAKYITRTVVTTVPYPSVVQREVYRTSFITQYQDRPYLTTVINYQTDYKRIPGETKVITRDVPRYETVPVTSVRYVTYTSAVPQYTTVVNTRFSTVYRTATSIVPRYDTRTVYKTQQADPVYKTVTKVIVSTNVVTSQPPAVYSTAYRERTVTVTKYAPAQTVTKQQVVYRTNTVYSTIPAYSTVFKTRIVPVTSTQLRYVTSTSYSTVYEPRVVTRDVTKVYSFSKYSTETATRAVYSTTTVREQARAETVTRTSIVTATSVLSTTVPGPVRYKTEYNYVTRRVPEFVTRLVQRDATSVVTRTIACSTGYNYQRPAEPLIY